MLAAGMQVLLQPPHALAAVGEKYHLLVFLHALELQQLPEPSTRLLVKGLNEAEALARFLLLIVVAPECHHTLARDDLEKALLVRRPHEAAVDAHRHWAVRRRLRLPVLFSLLEKARFLLTQIRLHTLGRSEHMVADGHCV